MAFKHSAFPPDPPPPLHIVSPKNAHFKGFWKLAWVNMGQIWLKIALNHLFEHPKCLGTTLERIIFDHFWTQR